MYNQNIVMGIFSNRPIDVICNLTLDLLLTLDIWMITEILGNIIFVEL